MENYGIVSSFFTKISRIGDQITSIGVVVDEDDLIQTVIDGLPSTWETFLAVVNGREVQPRFERLWHDCLQEEGRNQNKTIFTKEENFALTTRTKRRKKHFAQEKFSHPKNKLYNKEFDKSKIICYNCNNKGHYVRGCQEKQRGKGRFNASTAIEDETT